MAVLDFALAVDEAAPLRGFHVGFQPDFVRFVHADQPPVVGGAGRVVGDEGNGMPDGRAVGHLDFIQQTQHIGQIDCIHLICHETKIPGRHHGRKDRKWDFKSRKHP